MRQEEKRTKYVRTHFDVFKLTCATQISHLLQKVLRRAYIPLVKSV